MIKNFLSTVVLFALSLSLNAQEKITITGNNIRFVPTPSVSTSEPLVIVNGSFVTDMKSLVIDPSHIESIDILKDASATALYGSKGVSGVIRIKTKPGITFYMFSDFINAEKNASIQKIKLNETVLPDMKKLLVEKKELKQATVSSGFALDENCKAILQDMLVITTASGK